MNNFTTSACWLSGALLCGVAHAQQAPATATNPARPANVLNTTVTPTAATPAETLLALAKDADFNVLADVSNADAAPTVLALGKERPLFGVLRDLTNAQKWSWQQVEPRTFLMWKLPDTLALAREIIANAPVTTAATPDVAAVVGADVEPLNVALTRYFATPAALNDPKNPTDWREVPLLELPPDLRDRIIQSARAEQRGGLQFAASSAVLGDDFWKTAVLKLGELNVPAPLAPGALQKMTPAERIELAKAPANLQKYLFVAGRFDRDGNSATTMLSLGRWEKAPAQ